ncbi:MAG: hypothetical protein PVG75_07260 [Thioalkalispiraceae bacterium]|jgi:hypothetical protein
MQINTHHNLPIIAGYDRAQQQRRHRPDPEAVDQTRSEPIREQLIVSQYSSATLDAQRVRQTVDAQPMFNQQLSQPGEMARRTYQVVALAGEAELTNRLDVFV